MQVLTGREFQEVSALPLKLTRKAREVTADARALVQKSAGCLNAEAAYVGGAYIVPARKTIVTRSLDRLLRFKRRRGRTGMMSR